MIEINKIKKRKREDSNDDWENKPIDNNTLENRRKKEGLENDKNPNRFFKRRNTKNSNNLNSDTDSDVEEWMLLRALNDDEEEKYNRLRSIHGYNPDYDENSKNLSKQERNNFIHVEPYNGEKSLKQRILAHVGKSSELNEGLKSATYSPKVATYFATHKKNNDAIDTKEKNKYVNKKGIYAKIDTRKLKENTVFPLTNPENFKNIFGNTDKNAKDIINTGLSAASKALKGQEVMLQKSVPLNAIKDFYEAEELNQYPNLEKPEGYRQFYYQKTNEKKPHYTSAKTIENPYYVNVDDINNPPPVFYKKTIFGPKKVQHLKINDTNDKNMYRPFERSDYLYDSDDNEKNIRGVFETYKPFQKVSYETIPKRQKKQIPSKLSNNDFSSSSNASIRDNDSDSDSDISAYFSPRIKNNPSVHTSSSSASNAKRGKNPPKSSLESRALNELIGYTTNSSNPTKKSTQSSTAYSIDNRLNPANPDYQDPTDDNSDYSEFKRGGRIVSKPTHKTPMQSSKPKMQQSIQKQKRALRTKQPLSARAQRERNPI